MSEQDRVHPHIPEVAEQLRQGRVSRREFLRVATLLGMSYGAAQVLAACGSPAPAGGGASVAEAPAAEAPAAAPAAGSIKRGGVMRVGTGLPAVDHPARFSWIRDSNVFRHVFEYLTETDGNNITTPLLLEQWEASDDLTEWTLTLKKGIMWTNGDELVAEHVKFNFAEWLNPDVGSSILGLWEGFLTPDGVEVVDSHTIALHLRIEN